MAQGLATSVGVAEVPAYLCLLVPRDFQATRRRRGEGEGGEGAKGGSCGADDKTANGPPPLAIDYAARNDDDDDDGWRSAVVMRRRRRSGRERRCNPDGNDDVAAPSTRTRHYPF